MSKLTAAAAERPPEPNWPAITAEELVAYRDAENRFRTSDAARAITGEPAPGAAIDWQEVALPGREVPVRVYRPSHLPDGDGGSRTDLSPRASWKETQ